MKKKAKNRKAVIILTCILVLLTLFFLAGSDRFWDALNPVLYQDLIYGNAERYKTDALFVAALINCESSFNRLAVSKAGAIGLMQLMPETAAELALEKRIDYVNPEELYKPEVNIEIGTCYIVKLLRRYNGNRIFTLAAYNAGLKNADAWYAKYKGGGEEEALRLITFPETRNFVNDVLTSYRWFGLIRKAKRILQLKEQ